MAVANQEATEMTKLLPAAATAEAQTQTAHNDECGCKAITTAVGR